MIEMKYRYFSDLQSLAQKVVVSHPSFPIFMSCHMSYLANKLRINLQMAAGHLISIEPGSFRRMTFSFCVLGVYQHNEETTFLTYQPLEVGPLPTCQLRLLASDGAAS